MRLERPNGYFSTWDPVSGRKIEGETHSCVHCGYMWVKNPQPFFFSPETIQADQKKMRGKCLKCFGLVCARDECLKKGCVPLMQQIEQMENANRRLIIT